LARLQSVHHFTDAGKVERSWLLHHGDVLCELLHVSGRGWRWWVSVYDHAPVGIWWPTMWGAGADFLRSRARRG